MKTRTMYSRVAIEADLETLTKARDVTAEMRVRREHGGRTFPPEWSAVERAGAETTTASACVGCGAPSAEVICEACRALLRDAAGASR